VGAEFLRYFNDIDMKRNLVIMLVLILFTGYAYSRAGQDPEKDKAKLRMLRAGVSENLTANLLPYWSRKMTDRVNGGFYGRIDRNDIVYPDAAKGGILNARILWTFSSAYRVLRDTGYLGLATRARDFILTRFIDPVSGGAYRSLNADGTPSDDRKQTYTEAFFIYSLAEYTRATGDRESLEQAMKIFSLLESKTLDRESNGYFEVYTRDWKRLNDKLIGEPGNRSEKTMNTHLHVMEAYANLYRVSHDRLVGDRLRNLVELFLGKIVDKKTGHLVCFFDRNWEPTSETDSFGHDIEASWLLYEAAGLLGDKDLLDRVKKVSVKIADAASEGIQPDGGMLTERDRSTGKVTKDRSWWEQAETVVGNLNAYSLTGDVKYLDRSVACWNYINRYFVDHRNGGWYSYVTAGGEPGQGDKAGFWICPYHNGRMCLEVFERTAE
jgi:cellobiose epimerase